MSILRSSTLSLALIAAAGVSAPAFAQRVEQARVDARAEVASERASDAVKDARAASKIAKHAAQAAAHSGDPVAADVARAASIAAEDAKNDAVQAAHQATGVASGVDASAAPLDAAATAVAAARAAEQARNRAAINGVVAVDAALPPVVPVTVVEATIVPVSPNASANAVIATSAPGAMADYRHMNGAGRFHIDTAVLDVNHDGYLSREEAAANVTLNNQFATLDSSDDGRISTDELRTWIGNGGLARNSLPLGDALAGVGQASAFQLLDLDNDGMLTTREAAVQTHLNGQFRSLDTNRDGRLSQAEFDAWSRAKAGTR